MWYHIITGGTKRHPDGPSGEAPQATVKSKGCSNMKETTKMSRAIAQLEGMYRELNHDFWEDALPLPIITVQSKPGSWGHATTHKVWTSKDERRYELNISAECVGASVEQIVDTLLHEMVHIYCRENDIQEVSRGGSYHNGTFKALAESHGCYCVKTEKYGWNTEPDDRLIEYTLSKDWTEIRIGRNPLYGLLSLLNGETSGDTESTPAGGEKPEIKPGKKPSSTRKYQCPCCGMSVRATKEVRVLCMDCNVQLEKVD